MSTKRKIAVPQDSDIKDAVAAPEAFKQSLVDTLQESNTARGEMKVVLHELLKQPDTITEIKKIIDKVDRDAVKVFWSKFGFAVWSALTFTAGIVVSILIQHYMK